MATNENEWRIERANSGDPSLIPTEHRDISTDAAVLLRRNRELEAELAELRQERDDYKSKWDGREGVIAIERYDRRGHFMDRLHADRDRLEAELAELRASSVVYRVRCENPECRDGEIATLGPEHTDPCPDCVDGWQLADGVRLVKFPEGATTPTYYVVPARLIEGDT